MNKNLYWLGIFAFLYPRIGVSDVYDTDNYTSFYQMEAGAGWSFFKDCDNEIVSNLTPGAIDRLKQTSQAHFVPFHIGVARTFVLSPYTFITVGPHMYYQQARWSGDVFQLGDPLLRNYTYRIKNNIWSLLLEGRWQFEAFDSKRIHPYLFTGVGMAVAKLSYCETPNFPNVPNRFIASPSRSGTKLAVNVGVGVDVDLSDQISLGGKYIFYFYNGHHAPQRSATIGDFPLSGPMRFNSNAPCVFINLTYKLVNGNSPAGAIEEDVYN